MKKFITATNDYSQLLDVAIYIQNQYEQITSEKAVSRNNVQSISLINIDFERLLNVISTSIKKMIYKTFIESASFTNTEQFKNKEKIKMTEKNISTMQRLIDQTVQAAIRVLRANDEFWESSKEREEFKSFEDSDIDDAEAKRWNTANIEYFDSYLNKSYEEDEIVTIEKNIYYRNVMLFVKKIKNIAQIKESVTVRIDLNECLREAAQNWYIAELFNLKRTELRADIDEVNVWCEALIQRFKELTEMTLNKLTFEKYILKNAKNRRESASYVQTIVRHAKKVNISKMLNQLIFAHEEITAEL